MRGLAGGIIESAILTPFGLAVHTLGRGLIQHFGNRRVSRSFDTYKYEFTVDDVVVFRGVTNDLARRESEHRHRWPNGRIEQVGRRTTRSSAMEWIRQQEAKGDHAVAS